MTKVVINKCYGGFSISPEAALWLYEHGFRENGFVTPVEEYWKHALGDSSPQARRDEALERWREYQREGKRPRSSLFVTVFTPDEKAVLNTRPDDRSNPLLVECVETLKKRASGGCASLKVVKVPKGVEWELDEYDGVETLREKSRVFG